MPITITDTDGGCGNILRAWGDLTEHEVLKAHEDHFGQPVEKFSAYRYGLSDFSEVIEVDISSRGVHELSQMSMDAAKRHPDIVVAVVGSADLVFGLARMFESLVDDAAWEILVSRTRSDAVTWIRNRVRERFGMDVLRNDELGAAIPAPPDEPDDAQSRR